MKVRIKSRSGQNQQDSVEVPDSLPDFMDWMWTQGLGRFSVHPPGERIREVGGGPDPDPDLWTIYLQDMYD